METKDFSYPLQELQIAISQWREGILQSPVGRTLAGQHRLEGQWSECRRRKQIAMAGKGGILKP